jgi:hypothetical protein
MLQAPNPYGWSSAEGLEKVDTIDPERAPEARAAQRSNMFLAAVLQGPGFSAPVKVRNMSATGALVEAAAVPGPSIAVRLIRGSLVAPAVVAWSGGSRCGLRFSSIVSVPDWLAAVRNSEQNRVDDTVRLLKLGAVPLPQRPIPPAAAENFAGPAALAMDIQRVLTLIQSLGDDLASDQNVLLRHSARLQHLDIAIQTLSAVADALSVSTVDDASLTRLENLRSGCAEALAGSA